VNIPLLIAKAIVWLALAGAAWAAAFALAAGVWRLTDWIWR
jgi:hypothetical protein